MIGSVSTWPHTECPLTLEFACTLTVLKGGMVTFHVVRTGSLNSVRQNFLTSKGSPFGEEWHTSSFIAVLSELV